MSRYFRYIIILTLLPFSTSFGQQNVYKKHLDWGKTPDGLDNFSDCGYKEIGNEVYAVFYDRIPITNALQRVKLRNSKYAIDLNSNEIRTRHITSQVDVLDQYVSYEKGEPILYISIFPYRVTDQNIVERLTDFQYHFFENPNTGKVEKQFKTTHENFESVLSKGSWYKFKINQEGIHKITGSQLGGLSFDIKNIEASSIKIYGHKGGMLPEIIMENRTNDLDEIPVEVVDNNANNRLDGDDYIRFYAQPSGKWEFVNGHYIFEQNVYTDESYVYLTFNGTNAKNIKVKASGEGLYSKKTIDYFYDVVHHERDEVNFIASGRLWFGNEFRVNSNQTFNHSFKEVKVSLPGIFTHRFAGRAIGVTSSLNITVNGQNSLLHNFSKVSGDYDETHSILKAKSDSFTLTGNTVEILYSYNNNGGEGNGWIDYYTLEVPVKLGLYGAQKIARSKEAVDFDIVTYQFDMNNSEYNVWDVTNFFDVSKQQLYSNQEGRACIIPTYNSPVIFVLFKDGQEILAEFVENVENQNLHVAKDYDFVIISHPEFLAESNRLAEFHQQEYEQKVFVVNSIEIYNEFSAGKLDPTAIRDFIRMIYRRGQKSGNSLQHVLLMGDGSYDFKNKLANNTNYIPTFQSRNSTNPTYSYSSDDYYAILDDSEGYYDEALKVEGLDIGIGRIPCMNITQAKTMVDKIIHYHDPTIFGDWQNKITLLGDDEDNGIHAFDSETAFNYVNQQEPVYNINKIYLDSYVQKSFGSGEKYPEVNLAITKAFEQGTLVFNYIGHGGPSGMASERVVTRDEIRNWDNYDRLALMVTATCELSRFDDPSVDSPGELMLFNNNGGAIALVTTMRLVYISLNRQISARIWDDNIVKLNGGVQYLGETFINSKNRSSQAVNLRNFSLLGDPAMKLAIPEHQVVTTKISSSLNDSINIDTLNAFSRIKISGEIQKLDGTFDPTFNGVVTSTVYDKFFEYQTLVNDEQSIVVPFKLQNSIIYRGKASVTGGKFSFQFVVPKDISYNYGFGKISYFAKNETIDATGFDTTIVIGGSSSSKIEDNEGPKIDLYLNDKSWVFGGTSNPTPLIICNVFDVNGINTVGNGIGRDITAIIDAGTQNEKIIVLNEYYEANLNSYQEGTIEYKLEKLSPGRHTLLIRVWDVYNNASEDHTEFLVVGNEVLSINNLLNFPNPFTSSTTFHFDHNKSGQTLNVLIRIITPTGRIVKTFETTEFQSNSHFDKIVWNGKDEFGGQLARGVYLYKISLKSEDGQFAESTQKLYLVK